MTSQEGRVWRVMVETRAVIELRAMTEEAAVDAVKRLCPAALVTSVEVREPNGTVAGDRMAAVDARGEEA